MSKASIDFTLGNCRSKHGSKEIKRELDSLKGVLSVSVNNETEHVSVDFDTTGVDGDRIQDKLETLGYEVLDARIQNHRM